jgi:WD40 repeat protein
MTQPAAPAPGKQPKWERQLTASSFVNWLGISDNGSRVVADTYYYPYAGTKSNKTGGKYGTFCYDSAGTLLWSDEYQGDEGVFATALSGDGKIAASGGMYSGGMFADRPDSGWLRVYDAANGAVLLDYPGVRRRVTSMALSRDGSVVAAVATNKIQVFVRKNGRYPTDPVIPVGDSNFLYCVAVHPGGEWLVACDKGGGVHLVTIEKGVVGNTYQWFAREPAAGGAQGRSIPLLAVAIAGASEYFAVGGGNAIYLFTKSSMAQGKGPVAQFTPNNEPPSGKNQNVRWVGISGDGTFVSSVENKDRDDGQLRGLWFSGGKLAPHPGWQQNPLDLKRNPNSTSVDLAGKYVTAAEGNPVGTPGTFYLFDAKTGAKVWEFGTDNMNWPMFISADGSAVAGGSDNGKLYYFTV